MADERVRSAIAHWAPRFIANGVDPSDFARVTQSIDRWEDWCRAWCAAAEVYEELGRAALAEGRHRSAGAQLARAAVYYHFAKFLFVQELEEMRAAHQRAVRCLNDALPMLDPPGHRVTIAFESGEMVGVLRLPPGDGPHPVVVLIAGLDSAKEEFRSTEQLFLERGLATFAVDGPGQGEAEYDLPIRPDWEVPGGAILDALSALSAVDAGRIGLWGVSLGGYYAPRLASADARVRACIALAGPYDFGEDWERLPDLTRAAFRVRARCASDAEAARRAAELTLAGRADSIRAPLQIVFGKQDRLIPWRQATRLAAEAGGPVELLLFEDGNHVCTNISWHHRLRSADWMAEQLLGPTGG
ncbi:MAG TPA: YqiA/YcfP family alpha/beta fold hydrolase [Candidatus Dormibacteraeota bacterium]|nr:YqiA/YcfP family alpha/beta fold hydrolase [Candidatus Dormibacteraeota bacterium]